MITLRQLRYFQALAATGHFGRAAEAAGVSQPALSMQLRELEAELGGALVERTSAGAELTDLGREVAERAGDILAAVRDLQELAHARGAVLAGPVRLGVIPSVAPYLLPRLFEQVAARYPHARLTVRETITDVLTAELAAGALDAIVASLPLDDDKLAEAAAFDDAFVLAAPAGSPHARRARADPAAIRADELLLLEDGHCLRDQALAVCRAIDPHRLSSVGATSLATIVQLVAAGQGITLVPELAIDAGVINDPRLKLVRFVRPEPHRTIGLAWRKRSPRERDFRALAELVAAAGKARPAALKRALVARRPGRYTPATFHHPTGATMAVERTFSMIKPDATARNLTGAINAKLEAAGLRIVAQKRVWMSRQAGGGLLRRPPRAAVLRRALRVHVVGPDRGAGAGGRGRRRQKSRGDGRHRPRQGRRRHHPQGVRQIDRRELGARLRRAGDGGGRDRLLVRGGGDRGLGRRTNRTTARCSGINLKRRMP